MTARQLQSIRVLVVDDHSMVRSGLVAFLESYDDLQLAGEACNGEQALELCARVCPDVVLMDLMLPGIDGATVTRTLLQRCPQVKVLVLTSFDTSGMVQQALQAGATGYLLKNVSAEELAQVIRSVHAGRLALAPEAARALVESSILIPVRNLTSRECEVLSLMARGLSNTRIAEQLALSESTIKFHIGNILAKLGASSRTEAVAIATKYGLIS